MPSPGRTPRFPGGRVDEGARELVLRTLGRFPDPAAFNDLVVANIGNSPVRIRDIGYAEDGHKEQRTFATYDGTPAVAIELRRQSGANTIEVINNVKARLDRVRQLLPTGVRLDVVQDQSRYIEAAFHEVQLHLILGAILASLVVLLFMRNWRATVIAAVAIPASIIATFGAMYWLNFTLNNITMLALVLMVGVVIDDAIVVLENIFRFIEEKKMPPMLAAVHATRDIGLAVMATTLSLVVVFLPVSFMSSISGTVSLLVRSHRSGGDLRVAHRQLQPDADDELAHAAAGPHGHGQSESITAWTLSSD